MITLTTVGAWLASPIVGFFAKMLIDWLSSRRAQDTADANAKNLGRVTAERDQEVAGREALEREIEALQNAPQTVDDAIARLEDGSA